jgi:hypothetical protein
MTGIYRDAASQILNTVRNLNSKMHVYKEIDATTFQNVSHKFYKYCQKELEKLGFEKIADVEDVTLRGLKYCRPTFFRIMGNTGLKINANFYDSNPFLLIRVLSFLKHFNLKIYEFNTHFSNDIFLESSIVSSTIQNVDIPLFIKQYGQKKSIKDLLRFHKNKQDEIASANKDLEILYIDSFDSFIQNEKRLFEIKREKLSQAGWVSKEYLYNQVGKNKEIVDLIYNEIQEILAEECAR